MVSLSESSTPPTASRALTVIEVGPDGSGAAPRAMTLEEYRIIAEQLVLGLLDAGIDVGEWKHDAGT